MTCTEKKGKAGEMAQGEPRADCADGRASSGRGESRRRRLPLWVRLLLPGLEERGPQDLW